MNTDKFFKIGAFIKELYPSQNPIPLHAPVFNGNEKKYVCDAIDSTFVSSVGQYVNQFEGMMSLITGSSYSIAVVNGTNALHIALLLGEVKRTDEVLTQSLTFIATCNAISYIGAYPIFIDVDLDTLGMSPNSLENFLTTRAEIRLDGFCYNKTTGRRIKACVPMHTFGLPCRIEDIKYICEKWNISLIEDSAESLGSFYAGRHTGTFGTMGVFSFNGNKTVTCGGGGAIITNDEKLAKRAKHITTQAKIQHQWEFVHDEVGYNYRMPNLNAALACAQLEKLDDFVKNKRAVASLYHQFFKEFDSIQSVIELDNARSNYWLNAIIFNDKQEKESFLHYSNKNGIMTRPVWRLMNKLPMFALNERGDLQNSEWLADRIINLPSSVRHES